MYSPSLKPEASRELSKLKAKVSGKLELSLSLS